MEIKKEKDSNQILFKEDGLPRFVFPKLDEMGIVEHLFTTRLGGVSKGIFESLNLSFSRGDDKEAVFENYRRVARQMGCEVSDIVTSDQTHTTNVKVITNEQKGCGLIKPRDYTDTDGLITNVPGICLSTFYADCVPLYFVDPVKKVIGLSHSGWRGTVCEMGRVTVEKMSEVYGTNPADVIAAIGPSICQDCYEVSGDVASKFLEKFGQDKAIAYHTHDDKYQLNLWEANKRILIRAGVKPENISTAEVCTCCNSKLLFSHRASKGKRGNLGAFLMLR